MELPEDVVLALERAQNGETNELAKKTLATVLENVTVARETKVPMCQDTGLPIFYVHYPKGTSQAALIKDMEAAVGKATENSYLRPNAVDTITGKNSGTCVGPGIPIIHMEEWNEDHMKVELVLKGGGSENVGAQYKLLDAGLKAGRNLDGVRRCVIDAVHKAQGKGCSPGVVSACIGGDRGTGFAATKKGFLRKLDDKNPDSQLAELEDRLYSELNELGIGPMGFGGKTTVLGVKISNLHRHPACYFVSVSYSCWACRRATMTFKEGVARYE